MVVVIVPALNEEKTIGTVISDIPRDVVDIVKVVVIDDGSTDDTVKAAKDAGADEVISFRKNKGLAEAFRKGLDVALEMGADIVVNIDADGQYQANEIPQLIKPILDEVADMVLGSRFKGWIEEMPIQKRIGNKIATKVTALASGYPVSDAQTGFRALSREAALRLNILSNYTYTQETIVQAARKGLRIVEVPCTFRKRVGKSRLITNIFSYARRGGLVILTTYRDYKPLKTFMIVGVLLLVVGLSAGLRVLVHYLATGMVTPYLPTAVLTGVLLIVGFQVVILALIADMIGSNRKLMEEILYRIKKRNHPRS
jgi:glycosyltransferase involved in cell wall biosynthesis